MSVADHIYAKFARALTGVGYVIRTATNSVLGNDPTLWGGAGYPTGTEPNASIWTRTDGLDGPLYTRSGGVWDPARAVPSGRVELEWQAGRRGKPGLNADINSATEAVREIADPDFEILGTNATSASCTYWAEGGVTLTTAGASGDQVILAPHLDANQSPWSRFSWGTDKRVAWEAIVWTAASIATMKAWIGLKLTNTRVVATDANQAFVLYDSAVDAFWHHVTSIADTDTNAASTVAVTALTKYRVRIEIDSARLCKVYINGTLVKTTTAMADAIDLIPYIGIESSAVAPVALNVQRQRIGRDAG